MKFNKKLGIRIFATIFLFIFILSSIAMFFVS